VLPVLGREVVERQQRIAVLGQANNEPRRLLRTGSAALDKAGDSDAVLAPVDLAALQRTLILPAELGEAAFMVRT